VIRSKLSFSSCSMCEKSPVALLGERKDDLLGLVDEVDRVAGPVLAEPRDLLAGADEPAQGRHLGHDPRVVGRVRGRRHERGQLVDAAAAADLVELASALELVDERDRVHRLAAAVQRQRRAEHGAVAAAIEVAGVEDL